MDGPAREPRAIFSFPAVRGASPGWRRRTRRSEGVCGEPHPVLGRSPAKEACTFEQQAKCCDHALRKHVAWSPLPGPLVLDLSHSFHRSHNSGTWPGRSSVYPMEVMFPGLCPRVGSPQATSLDFQASGPPWPQAHLSQVA